MVLLRKIFNENPIRIEYVLTKKGEALRPVLVEMAKFSSTHCCEEVFSDAKPHTLRQVYDNSLHSWFRSVIPIMAHIVDLYTTGTVSKFIIRDPQ